VLDDADLPQPAIDVTQVFHTAWDVLAHVLPGIQP
jgi:hypothetical protein